MRHQGSLALLFSAGILLGAAPTAPEARADEVQEASTSEATSAEARVAALQEAFRGWSGARLVFTREDLPEGGYHDEMWVIEEAARREAALTLLLDEVRKYPPGFLGDMGLEAIGVFDATISHTGDGFRPYDEDYEGYVYYGIWNGRDGIAAAYYTDGQLPLTFHHEIFHHVDGTNAGETAFADHFRADDERFAAAIAGDAPYPAPDISEADLEALRAASEGYWLEESVGRYSSKGAGEDQAETARYLMTTLPDALVQVVESPELPGSQRMLHVLRGYAEAVPDGPQIGWFVDVALGRAPTQP